MPQLHLLAKVEKRKSYPVLDVTISLFTLSVKHVSSCAKCHAFIIVMVAFRSIIDGVCKMSVE